MIKRPVLLGFIISVVIAIAVAGGMYLWGTSSATAPLFGGNVGVVEVYGLIDAPGVTIEDLDKFRRDDSIEAVVLRVDSPGGGVAASQEIYREVKRLADAKPVVCSMGALAASGGYYISAPATRIMANPGTITGAIGVISTIPDMQKLFEKIGIRMQVIKSGELKGAGQIDRPLSEKERAMLQSVMDEIHQQFVADVAHARELPMDEVRRLATGGIYTGQKALELGLVDEMGGFNDAVDLAAKLAGITGRPNLIWPQDERGWLSRLMEDQAKTLVRQFWQGLTASSGPMYLYRTPGS